MHFEDFSKSTAEASSPPESLSPELTVLWLAKNDQWDAAHDIAQDLPDPNGAWLHAYLHRVEGDLGNAGYWYHRAGQPMPNESLDSEWHALSQYFCKKAV